MNISKIEGAVRDLIDVAIFLDDSMWNKAETFTHCAHCQEPLDGQFNLHVISSDAAPDTLAVASTHDACPVVDLAFDDQRAVAIFDEDRANKMTAILLKQLVLQFYREKRLPMVRRVLACDNAGTTPPNAALVWFVNKDGGVMQKPTVMSWRDGDPAFIGGINARDCVAIANALEAGKADIMDFGGSMLVVGDLDLEQVVKND